MAHRICITGYTGNIGAYILEKINNAYPNADVMALAQSKTAELQRPGAKTNKSQVNLLDQSESYSKIQDFGPTILIHAAASNYNRANIDMSPWTVCHRDIGIYHNVLNAINPSTKIVLLSSALVYENVDQITLSEGEDISKGSPTTCYAVAKCGGAPARTSAPRNCTVYGLSLRSRA
jgi:nucleoside-diphosphate-sugar epimerase